MSRIKAHNGTHTDILYRRVCTVSSLQLRAPVSKNNRPQCHSNGCSSTLIMLTGFLLLFLGGGQRARGLVYGRWGFGECHRASTIQTRHTALLYSQFEFSDNGTIRECFSRQITSITAVKMPRQKRGPVDFIVIVYLVIEFKMYPSMN